MRRRFGLGWVLAALLTLSGTSWAQTTNGAITGVVKDSSGGVVADAALTLRNVKTDQTVRTAVSGPDGEFSFRNLAPALYTIDALKTGFQQVTHPDIEVTLSSTQRVEITLPVGAQETKIEVVGGSSVLSVTATQEHGISPETLNQLPLLMNSGPRAAAGFAVLMPGVATGGRSNAFDARINGGLQSGDEASVDGVSMQQGFMSQGGMVSIFQDFPMSPDMVSEVKVLTSNYAPEYGSSTSGQIMAVTKSGGSSFHGSAFEFHRDDSLKAKQWGADEQAAIQSQQLRGQHRRSGQSAWPHDRQVEDLLLLRLRGLSADRRFEPADAVDSVAPGAQRGFPRLARSSRKPDSDLRPAHDPARRPGGLYQGSVHGLRRQHAQRDLPDRASAPSCKPWLAALPNPSSGGPLNNYLAPAIPDTILGNSDYYMGRVDVQFGSNDHMFASFWHQQAPPKFASTLPQSISNDTYSDPQNSWVNRFNYDRIFPRPSSTTCRWDT